jgi:polar amino acid transport system permease protein
VSIAVPDRRAVREAARRRRARRGAAIAALSTVVVLGGLAALILTSQGWPNVRATFLSWPDFKEAFPDVLKGFWLDVKLFVIVEVFVLILGLVIAVVRTTRAPARYPLRLGAAGFTDVMRGAALTLSYSAYVAEVYRAGIDSIGSGQRAAALAVGLTPRQTMRFVVLPQAVRRVVPPLLNDFIALQKDVALVSILGPQEAFRAAQIFASSNFNYTPLLAAALLYLCVTIPMARWVDRMQSRTARARGAALAVR